jgi:hypothetical protein
MELSADDALLVLADTSHVLAFIFLLIKLRWGQQGAAKRRSDLSHKTQVLLMLAFFARNIDLFQKPKKNFRPLLEFVQKLPAWRSLGVGNLLGLYSTGAAYGCMLRVLVLSSCLSSAMSIVLSWIGGHRGPADPIPLTVLASLSLFLAAGIHSQVLHEDIFSTKPALILHTASFLLEALALLPQMFCSGAGEALEVDNDEPVEEKPDSPMSGPDSITRLHFLFRGLSRIIPSGMFLYKLTSSSTSAVAVKSVKQLTVQFAGVVTSFFYTVIIIDGGDSRLLRMAVIPVLVTACFAVVSFAGLNLSSMISIRLMRAQAVAIFPHLMMVEAACIAIMLILGGSSALIHPTINRSPYRSWLLTLTADLVDRTALYHGSLLDHNPVSGESGLYGSRTSLVWPDFQTSQAGARPLATH